MNRRFDEQTRRFEQDLAPIRVELNAMRSDLSYVALAVGARPRPEANQA